MRLRSALGAATVIVVCLLAAMVGGHAPGAAASGPNRAVVVADSGTGVVVRGIEFEGESISGVEALQLAGLAPVLQGFDGQGGAVCALQGVGCPSDGSCLTCDARGYYWAYHRAPAGSGGFTYSRAGAGATRVHDGDVEGWKWGTGSPPPFHSFASVFPAPTTPPPTSPGGTGGGGAGGTGGGATPAPGVPGTPGVAAGTPSTDGSTAGGDGGPASTVAGATTSSAPATTTSTAGSAAGDRATSERTDGVSADEVAFQAARSSRSADASGNKGWVASAALFTVTLAVIAALVVRSRRRRQAA